MGELRCRLDHVRASRAPGAGDAATATSPALLGPTACRHRRRSHRTSRLVVLLDIPVDLVGMGVYVRPGCGKIDGAKAATSWRG